MQRIFKITYISIIFLLIMGLFCRFTEYYFIWKFMSLGLFILLLTDRKFSHGVFRLISSFNFMTLIFVVATSAFISPSHEYTINNIEAVFWPLFYVTFIEGGMFYKDKDGIRDNISNLFVPLNIVWIINLIVVSIQCTGRPFLIRSSWLAMNSFYPDQCAGLFGFNGTHELTTFSIFMNIVILSRISISSEKRNRLIAYLLVCDLWFLYISTKNDNVAIFLVLPAFIALFLFLDVRYKSKNLGALMRRISKYLAVFLVLIVVAISIPFIRSYIDEFVNIRIKMVFQVTNTRYQIYGSNERLAVAIEALSNGYGWLFGRGFGTANIFGGNYFGYHAFGLSSIGSFIMLGGIWFYISYTLVICRILHFFVKNTLKTDWLVVLLAAYCVLYTAYTILYTSFVSTIWFSLIFLEIGEIYSKYNVRRESSMRMR